MGKKSSPAQTVPMAQKEATPDLIDRETEDLNRRSAINAVSREVMKTSTLTRISDDGEEETVKAPQSSLLAERDYWDKKKSLLSK
jgi:hypothetical protein